MQSKHGAMATSLLVLAFGGVVAEGCSGSSDEHPAAGAGGGTAAGAAGGGTSGKGTGARPNTAGTGGGGGRPAGGNGGTGGSSRAGTGGGSGAGDGGTSGQPACDCTLSESEFSCSAPLDAVSISVPQDCELDLGYLRREQCDGGYTRYRWAEGGENDYELFADANGKVVYVSAFGYVTPPCDLPRGANDLGSYTAGKRPNTTCTGECTVCETDGPGAGGAGAGGAGSGGAGGTQDRLPECPPY